jgi:hypothetical protein
MSSSLSSRISLISAKLSPSHNFSSAHYYNLAKKLKKLLSPQTNNSNSRKILEKISSHIGRMQNSKLKLGKELTNLAHLEEISLISKKN